MQKQYSKLSLIILSISLQANPSAAQKQMNKRRGSLIGGAICDALGTAVEATNHNSEFLRTLGTNNKYENNVKTVAGMEGGGPWRNPNSYLKPLPIGGYTDDTIMARHLAQSLIRKKTCDTTDIARSFCKWWHSDPDPGKGQNFYHGPDPLSPTKECFDIGITTRRALQKFEETHNPSPNYKYEPDDQTAEGPTNGGIMRLAPAALGAKDPTEAIDWAIKQSEITHSHKRATEAARLLAHIIYKCITSNSNDKNKILDLRTFHSTDTTIDNIAHSTGDWNWKEKSLDKLGYEYHKVHGEGHLGGAAETLETALGVFYHTNNFQEGALAVVNMLGDADTTGSVYGQIAGGFYGFTEISKIKNKPTQGTSSTSTNKKIVPWLPLIGGGVSAITALTMLAMLWQQYLNSQNIENQDTEEDTSLTFWQFAKEKLSQNTLLLFATLASVIGMGTGVFAYFKPWKVQKALPAADTSKTWFEMLYDKDAILNEATQLHDLATKPRN